MRALQVAARRLARLVSSCSVAPELAVTQPRGESRVACGGAAGGAEAAGSTCVELCGCTAAISGGAGGGGGAAGVKGIEPCVCVAGVTARLVVVLRASGCSEAALWGVGNVSAAASWLESC